jgi:hypothetical protein
MGEGFTLSEAVSAVLGAVGITIPGLGAPGTGGRGFYTSPHAPTPLTPEEKQQYNQKLERFEEQKLPQYIQPKLKNMVPEHVAQLNIEDLIDVPREVVAVAVPTPPPTPTFLGVPLGVVYGVDAQGLAVALGVQGPFGFSPANPAFGWTDTFNLTARSDDAPVGVGAVPGAPGQGGTSATSDPTDSAPPGPGSPTSPDGSNW